MRDYIVGVSVLFGFFCVCGLVFIAAGNANVEKLRRQAIEAGVAEWRVDPKTGRTEFVFISEGKK